MPFLPNAYYSMRRKGIKNKIRTDNFVCSTIKWSEWYKTLLEGSIVVFQRFTFFCFRVFSSLCVQFIDIDTTVARPNRLAFGIVHVELLVHFVSFYIHIVLVCLDGCIGSKHRLTYTQTVSLISVSIWSKPLSFFFFGNEQKPN